MQQMRIGENGISKYKQHCSIRYQEKNIMDLICKPNTTNYIILAQSAINHRRTILILEAICIVTPPRNKHPTPIVTFSS